MFPLRTQSKTILQTLATILLLGALTLSVASADSLTIVNPNFSAVAVQCTAGWAYQSALGGNCEGSNGLGAQQNFNLEAGIGWTFAPRSDNRPGGDGITAPNTDFEPPSFTGLPFSAAALLQDQSVIFQKIDGFTPGRVYRLTFYLGSRYSNSGSCCNGNQTVLVTLDSNAIGLWKLVSFTPFTLRTAVFKVATGGSHILAFTGLAPEDNTAFISGVSIETASGQP